VAQRIHALFLFACDVSTRMAVPAAALPTSPHLTYSDPRILSDPASGKSSGGRDAARVREDAANGEIKLRPSDAG